MKKIVISMLGCLLACLSVCGQERVLWEGSPQNVFDGRYDVGKPFKEAGLQAGDALRIYLTGITEDQQVWLKLDGGAVNKPTLQPAGTLYFDHVLTADDITKIENTAATNVSYTKGGLYIKFEKTGQVYKITVRPKGTPQNRFGLYLGNAVKDNIYFTKDNNLLTLQAAQPAAKDVLVIQYSGAKAGDKMWVQNSAWGGSYGFADVLTPDDEGCGEMRVELTKQAASDFAESGCILHRSTVDYSIDKVYLDKYVKPTDVVDPPSGEIVLWSGKVSTGSIDMRYNAELAAVKAANISAKDTIKVYVSGAENGQHVILKEAKDWEGKYFDLYDGGSVAVFPIKAAYAEKIQSSSFSVQREAQDDYTVNYITVAKYTEPPHEEALATENTYIQWDGSTYVIPAAKLGKMRVGDIIHVYIDKFYQSGSSKDNRIEAENSKDASFQLQRKKSGEYHVNVVTGDKTNCTFSGKDMCVEVTQDMMDRMYDENGDMYDLVVSGYWYSFTKIILEHPSIPAEQQQITLTPAGVASFSSDKALDFAKAPEIKAYTVAVSGDKAVATLITGAVPAHTGLIVMGAEGTYQVPVTAVGDALTTPNDLVPTDGTEVTGLFVGKYQDKVAFYQLTRVVEAGKAYIPEAATSMPQLVLSFGDVTGIGEVTLSTPKVRKYIENGQVVIVRGDRKYSATGQLLK